MVMVPMAVRMRLLLRPRDPRLRRCRPEVLCCLWGQGGEWHGRVHEDVDLGLGVLRGLLGFRRGEEEYALEGGGSGVGGGVGVAVDGEAGVPCEVGVVVRYRDEEVQLCGWVSR